MLPWPTSEESGSRYNGPFSTWREVHASLLGGATGVIAAVAAAPWLLVALLVVALAGVAPSPALRELRGEAWYALVAAVAWYAATGVFV